MIRIIKIVGILGFVVSLLVIYMTNHGIPGIRRFDRSFRLLDMRFHYNSETVNQTFEQISEGGRIAYQKYLGLDFIFILCFLITMISITDAVFVAPHLRTILYILCGLRALFDITENILLLLMLRQYPTFNETLATICSWFTTFKFIMLYLWLLSIAIQGVVDGVKSLKRYL